MHDVLALAQDTVQRYEGTLTQVSGEGFVALFGRRWHRRTMPDGRCWRHERNHFTSNYATRLNRAVGLYCGWRP